MRIISWNTNRRRDVAGQIRFLLTRTPDIVALQEITASTAPLYTEGLMEAGFHYVRSTLTKGETLPSGPRSYGVLIGSKYPIIEEPGFGLTSPWPEKVLSLAVVTSAGPLEIHTAHVPPGSSNYWLKVEVLEAIYRSLALDAVRHRILCGDFNCPQTELPTGEVITWAQRLCPSGEIKIRLRIHREPGIRWDAAERGVLVGLREFGLRDAYRSVHGYSGEAASWFLKHKGKVVGRRFDHIFVSPELEVVRCEYLAEARSLCLSDHSPIEADVEWL